MLPLGEATKHHDKSESTTCTFCDHEHDNLTQHLLSCKHATTVAWRKTCKSEIQKHAKHLATRPSLIDVLLQGMETVVTANTPSIESEQHDAAIQAQHNIGWMPLFQGKWAKQWVTLQEECYEFSGTKLNQNNGHLWAVKMPTKSWDQVLQLWTSRNEHKHGKSNSKQEATWKRHAIEATEELHQKKKEMLMSDHVCLADNIEAWAKPKESAHLINWLHIWTLSFMQASTPRLTSDCKKPP